MHYSKLSDSDLEALKNKITEHLMYEPDTGNFIWIKASGSRFKAGSIAGGLDKDGYLKISLGRRSFRAHRLVWLITYGRMPKECIDHINGNKTDNRLENLREASHSQNAMNSKYRKNSSGFKGVVWHKRDQKWIARIRLNKKPIHIGAFRNLEDAVAARNKYELELFGDFRRETP